MPERIIHFYSHAKYGDNLEQLNYVRKLCYAYPNYEFVQYTNEDQLEQLQEVIEDLDPQVTLKFHGHKPDEAHHTWIGHEGFCRMWPGRNNDRVGFMIAWFQNLSKRAGVESPIKCAQDLLFDYPALTKPVVFQENFDVLVINSEPQSGQYRGFSREGIDNLARGLAQSNKVITIEKVDDLPCTRAMGLSLTEIGSLSRQCRAVCGVSTGPMWPTFNVWNTGIEFTGMKPSDFVYIVDGEYINYGDNFHKADNDIQAYTIMKSLGY